MVVPGEQKTFYALHFVKIVSVITVQGMFCAKYHIDPPIDKTTQEWYNKFEEMENPHTTVEHVHYFLKVTVLCAVLARKVYEHFSFVREMLQVLLTLKCWNNNSFVSDKAVDKTVVNAVVLVLWIKLGMLHHIWQDIDWIDVCRVTREGHIEHLRVI